MKTLLMTDASGRNMVGQATFAKGPGMLVSFFPEDLLSTYQVQVVSMVAVVLVT